MRAVLVLTIPMVPMRFTRRVVLAMSHECILRWRRWLPARYVQLCFALAATARNSREFSSRPASGAGVVVNPSVLSIDGNHTSGV